jgi:three-Cys-motif partner protein
VPQLFGSDGLRARDNGAWGEKKLAFLESFGPTAIDATERKQRRVYVDLFAGPGRNVERRSGGREFLGSPLRVLDMRGRLRQDLAFTEALFVNQNSRDHAALQERLRREIVAGRSMILGDHVHALHADANACLPDLLARVRTFDYLFVFADCEAPRQWPWRTVEALTASGHSSVDLYMLFPLEMGINRILAYRNMDEAGAQRLDLFFGTEAWRDIVARRSTPAQAPLCRRELVELYLTRLRMHWSHAGSVMDVHRRGNQRLYRMLFASNHVAGKKIADWAAKQAAKSDQGSLEL